MFGEAIDTNEGHATFNDPFVFSHSDHPGMSLTGNKFNGSNFLGWSRTVKMALGAKQKLCFKDGSCPKPPVTSSDFHKWVRCDYMVTCWLLNSLEAELSDAFLYAQSAAELWREISERFGHISGPQVYKIEKDLSEICQGDMTVAAYFTKLKRCWDELSTLNGAFACTCGQMTVCTCGLLERFAEMENRSRLMQFLLRLRSDFDSARSQILAMDPLPNVNKAYYIIQQIEAQQSITRHEVQHSAFMVNVPGTRAVPGGKREYRRNHFAEKKYCRHCHSTGHTFEQCFERIGYPDWFKGKKRRSNPRMAAHVHPTHHEEAFFDTPLEMQDGSQKSQESTMPQGKGRVNADLVSNMATMCQQMLKMMQNTESTDQPNSASINFAGPHY